MSPRNVVLAALAAALAAATGAAAQGGGWELRRCTPDTREDRPRRYCATREIAIPAPGLVSVRTVHGPVSVRRGSGPGVKVRVRVELRAESPESAREILGRIHVETAGGRLQAVGPGEEGWSASFEVAVPESTHLRLETVHGPVTVEDVRGDVHVRTEHGPVSLARSGRNVHVRTRHGPVRVSLPADRWDGTEVDIQTEHGPVQLLVPGSASARLRARTVNGPLTVDFPATRGRDAAGHTADATLGAGRALIRLETENGPIVVGRP